MYEGLGAVVLDGARPVVPVEAEPLRDQRSAQGDEDDGAGQEQPGDAQEVLGVAPRSVHEIPPGPVECSSGMKLMGRVLRSAGRGQWPEGSSLLDQTARVSYAP